MSQGALTRYAVSQDDSAAAGLVGAEATQSLTRCRVMPQSLPTSRRLLLHTSRDDPTPSLPLERAASPLGRAVIACTETHVTFDEALLDAMRAATMSLGGGEVDRGACGIVKVGFPVRSADYDERPYEA